ncbi:MAG: HU family DNA-binding protein [bacterium]
MKKSELLNRISTKLNMKRRDVEKTLEAFIETLCEGLRKESKVNVAGLGIWSVRDRKARLARNPKTGETVHVAAKKVVKFRVSKDMKTAVLG